MLINWKVKLRNLPFYVWISFFRNDCDVFSSRCCFRGADAYAIRGAIVSLFWPSQWIISDYGKSDLSIFLPFGIMYLLSGFILLCTLFLSVFVCSWEYLSFFLHYILGLFIPKWGFYSQPYLLITWSFSVKLSTIYLVLLSAVLFSVFLLFLLLLLGSSASNIAHFLYEHSKQNRFQDFVSKCSAMYYRLRI